MTYSNWSLTGSYAEPEYMTDAERERLEEIALDAIDRAVDRLMEDGL